MQPPSDYGRLYLMTLTGRSRELSVRRSLFGLSAVLASVVLTGCSSIFEGEPEGGGGPSSGSYEHPTGGQDVVVSVRVLGGYVPLEYNLRNTPNVLVLGDGTVIVAGVMDMSYPGPAINPLQTSTISEDQIQELLTAADEAGLLSEAIEYGSPSVTDMPDTVLELTTGGRTFSHSAYALGFDDGTTLGLNDSEIATREALQGFLDTAQGLVGADSEQYVPTDVVAYRLSAQAAPPVEEPELQQEPRIWPIATAPPPVAGTDLTSCVEIAGQEAAPLLPALQEATELTPWLIGTEPPARMAFRPLLPGDPGCEG